MSIFFYLYKYIIIIWGFNLLLSDFKNNFYKVSSQYMYSVFHINRNKLNILIGDLRFEWELLRKKIRNTKKGIIHTYSLYNTKNVMFVFIIKLRFSLILKNKFLYAIPNWFVLIKSILFYKIYQRNIKDSRETYLK